jgi:hypothetical protein
MSNIAEYDCFSQVVFECVEHYRMMKEDPYYKEHLFGDHETFADTKRSQYIQQVYPRRIVQTNNI